MNTQQDSQSQTQDLDKQSYAEQIERKDKQILELKQDREMLLKKLIEKEKEIATLNDTVRKFTSFSS